MYCHYNYSKGVEYRVAKRLTGCLKLQVIFCQRATNYRAFLQTTIYEDKTSYDSTPLSTYYCVIHRNNYYIVFFLVDHFIIYVLPLQLF